jgi:transcriptional regulator with XRE-family HTH domain
MKRTRTVFGRRLRERRLEKGFTQKGLGISAGINPASASARMAQYERGTHAPALETAAQLARVLGVSTAYFYAEQDDMAEFILRLENLSHEKKKCLSAIFGQRD